MHAEGIISHPVTEDIRLKGHQTIRFMPDGFSLMVSDVGFKPVLLKHYSFDSSVPAAMYPIECGRILKEMNLLDFGGETVFIIDTGPMTVVPAPFFDESNISTLLHKAIEIDKTDAVASRYIRDRNLHMAYTVSADMEQLRLQVSEQGKILHSAECLVSLSDQVQASDHQRGFVMADIQPGTLSLLVIQEDEILLLNRFALKDASDFIYHTLNTVKQLDLDRESIPVYLSGTVHPDHELYGLLGKYVRNVKTTPYYLEELTRTQMLRFMILSEGSKCA